MHLVSCHLLPKRWVVFYFVIYTWISVVFSRMGNVLLLTCLFVSFFLFIHILNNRCCHSSVWWKFSLHTTLKLLETFFVPYFTFYHCHWLSKCCLWHIPWSQSQFSKSLSLSLVFSVIYHIIDSFSSHFNFTKDIFSSRICMELVCLPFSPKFLN